MVLAISGGLTKTWNQVGQLGADFCFPYVAAGGITYVYYNDHSYRLPNNPPFYSSFRIKVVISSPGIVYLTYGRPIHVCKYLISGDTITLLEDIQMGDTNSNVQDFIRLPDGRLFLAWSQFETVQIDTIRYIKVCFAWYDSVWHQLPDELIPNAINASCKGALAVQGNSVWHFQTNDAASRVAAIKFNLADMSVSYREPYFLSTGLLKPDPEMPEIAAVTVGSEVWLAYPNVTRQRISTTSVASLIVVVKIKSDGTPELVEECPFWAERITPFCFGVEGGHHWIAYGKVNFTDKTWNDLYLYKQGNDTSLGKLNGGTATSMSLNFCNTTNKVIAAAPGGVISIYEIPEALKPVDTPSQLDMVIGECAELIVAIQHWKRNSVDSTEVLEAVVGVELCLEQLKLILDSTKG